jgi:CHAD domain-containing protein
MVQLDAQASAELCIDRGLILAGARRERINEVELELISGNTQGLLRFAQALALPLAYQSKAERGYRLAAGLRQTPYKWRMPRLRASEESGKAFAALFSAALMQAGTNAAGMLASRDPEYLHQLRVGLRRLGSALRAFAPLLEDARPIRRALRRLVPSLGKARDLDVFVETLEKAGVEPQLVRRARSVRNGARHAALETVASAEFQAFLFRSLRWLHAEPWREAPTLERLAPGRLDRLHRRAVAAFDWKTAQRRHRLRIRIKRLRYACEFFAPCFAPGTVDPYLRQLATLQDVLGELNDISVARRLLRRMDASAPARFDMREEKLIAALRAAWPRFESRPRYWRHPG